MLTSFHLETSKFVWSPHTNYEDIRAVDSEHVTHSCDVVTTEGSVLK